MCDDSEGNGKVISSMKGAMLREGGKAASSSPRSSVVLSVFLVTSTHLVDGD